jgi:ComF family protein
MLIASFNKVFLDFLNLFYPKKCLLCGNNLVGDNKFLCTSCLYDMPKTNFHNKEDNKTAQIFWGRVNLNFASSFLYFYKGSKYRKLIHLLKYKNKPEIGVFLGELYGAELINVEKIKNADYIVPVPLHPKKQRIRGYNQSEEFSKGLSKILEIPVSNLLRRKIFTETQTKKSREERWNNVKDVFEPVDCKKVEGKHIILTDDVVTTGATLEACMLALKKCGDVKISVLTLGIAQ